MKHIFNCTQYSYVAEYPDATWHHVFARFQLTINEENNVPKRVWVERFGHVAVCLVDPKLTARTTGLTVYFKDSVSGVKFQVNLARANRLGLLRLLRMCNVAVECRAMIGHGPSSGPGRPSSMAPMLMSEMYSGLYSGM